MPTLARLIAGAGFAALAWLASAMIEPGIPEGIRTQWFAAVDAALGAVLGWRILGARAGRGVLASVGVGISAAAAIYAAACAVWAVQQTLRAATRLRYDGPAEALEGALRRLVDFAALGARWEVMALLLLAAAGIGALSDLTAERRRR